MMIPYMEELIEKIADAVLEALNSMRPATIAYAVGSRSLSAHRDFWDEERHKFVCGFNPHHAADQTLWLARVNNDRGLPNGGSPRLVGGENRQGSARGGNSNQLSSAYFQGYVGLLGNECLRQDQGQRYPFPRAVGQDAFRSNSTGSPIAFWRKRKRFHNSRTLV